MKFSQSLSAAALAVCTTFAAIALPAQAATVSGGTLLDGAGARFLETEIGGASTFTHLWTGEANRATSASFHAAADAYNRTLSIYNIQHYSGEVLRVGGYTALSWDAEGGLAQGYAFDPAAFLFNLESGEVQRANAGQTASIYRHVDYFPTFGGGHDLMAGRGILATYFGQFYDSPSGHSRSSTYDDSQGQIVIAGDSGSGDGDSGWAFNSWHALSLEVYAVEDAPAIPLPAGLPMLLAGLAGFGALRITRRGAK